MSDRIVGFLFLGLSIWYGYTAGSYEASFGDPVGPAAFPQIISIPAALVSLGLILRPDPDPSWSRGVVALRQVGAIALFVAYALLLLPLGFVLSTFLAVTLFAMLIGATWLKAAIAGVVMAPALFVLFDVLLGLPLPLAPSL